ncbi:hypothetical protein PMKS-003853 [Pichia membranifaciens]|uniref:C2 NT-type domain-containing protein n=1 Tax=Pichia membranifaciens TaxID=4926 RepID=A0A1Q2YLC0_9ASCO|nr:hypothetical protein PMKS-003853 [Pichia membranifaciens]
MSSHTTHTVPIRNHRVRFGDSGKQSTEFRLQAQSNSRGDVLSDKWLCISFMLKNQDRQEPLGVLILNLTEYVNEKNKKELRFLLEKSKTNTIVKLNLQIRHLEHDESVTYQTAREQASPAHSIESAGLLRLSSVKSTNELSSRGGFSMDGLRTPTKPSSTAGRLALPIPSPSAHRSGSSMLERANSRRSSNPGMSTPSNTSSPTSSSPRSPKSSKCMFSTFPSSNVTPPTMTVNGGQQNSVKNIATQTMMNDACESAVNDVSLLDDLINKTYRFTWQLKCTSYEEFTPAECVKDIIERNGNGWKKNDEGVDLVDVVENEFKESSVQKRNRSSLFSLNNSVDLHQRNHREPDIFSEFKGLESVQLQESDEDSDDLDHRHGHGRGGLDDDSDSVIYSYYSIDRRDNSKVKRYKPLTEAEVREDLRSWHISAKS